MTQKATGKSKKKKDKEVEDIPSDLEKGDDNKILEQINATLAKKKQDLKKKMEQELKKSQESSV